VVVSIFIGCFGMAGVLTLGGRKSRVFQELTCRLYITSD